MYKDSFGLNKILARIEPLDPSLTGVEKPEFNTNVLKTLADAAKSGKHALMQALKPYVYFGDPVIHAGKVYFSRAIFRYMGVEYEISPVEECIYKRKMYKSAYRYTEETDLAMQLVSCIPNYDSGRYSFRFTKSSNPEDHYDHASKYLLLLVFTDIDGFYKYLCGSTEANHMAARCESVLEYKQRRADPDCFDRSPRHRVNALNNMELVTPEENKIHIKVVKILASYNSSAWDKPISAFDCVQFNSGHISLEDLASRYNIKLNKKN